ncbi:AAA family ATPase [Planctomicrobium sp. SH661]|uniref:AAA family ATPase n=1 Tax=Planctomicrobium sp. SH661 TaxID=3448124 RepID=UPI003F5C66DE
MTLAQTLNEYLRACFTGIWIVSHEHQDALQTIAELCREQDWQLAHWNLESGLSGSGSDPLSASPAHPVDPLSAIRSLNALATPEGTAILVLENFHRFLQSAEIVQALAQQILAGKQNRTMLIILSPLLQIPAELQKLFIVLEHELPDRRQLLEIAQAIGTDPGDLPEGAELELILDAASGLTRYEAEGAYSLSLVRHGRITPEALWELKTQTLKKGGLLTLHQGEEDFTSLGGLAALKAFTKRSLLPSAGRQSVARARGVLLLSPPGCGKSAFCKALGKEVGRPVLMLEIGQLMGSLVGQTEERTRQALRMIDAMAPCILMIEELEKAFAGVGSSGNADSGVSARMFGAFLVWLNDHDSDVYVVCTSNDVTRLPPEFARAERFDGVFFLDLPNSQERQAIWGLFLRQYALDPAQPVPNDTHWTGAEIRACCRLAALLELPLLEAAEHIVPVAVTAHERVQNLRSWAAGRCLSANTPGIYQRPAPKTRSSRRNVRREDLN